MKLPADQVVYAKFPYAGVNLSLPAVPAVFLVMNG